jgi:hypothetical protein
MKAVITLKPVRLNGKDVETGTKVDIDDNIYQNWLSLGLARNIPPVKDGDKHENKSNKPSGSRAGNAGRGKTGTKS